MTATGIVETIFAGCSTTLYVNSGIQWSLGVGLIQVWVRDNCIVSAS